MPALPGTSFIGVGYEAGEPIVHALAHFSYRYNGRGIGERTVEARYRRGLGFYINTRQREMTASRVKVPGGMVAVIGRTN